MPARDLKIKPSRRARLNLQHPLARDLAFSMQTPYYDVWPPSALGDRVFGGGGTDGPRRSDGAIVMGGSEAYIYSPNLEPIALKMYQSPGYTLLAVVEMLVGEASTMHIFTDDDGAWGSSPPGTMRRQQFRLTNDTQLQFIPFNDAGTPFFPGGVYLQDQWAVRGQKGPTLVAAVCDWANSTCWVRALGVTGTPAALSGTHASTTAGMPVTGMGGGTAIRSRVHAITGFNRALSVAEIDAFSANPYLLYEEPRTQFPGGVAAPASVVSLQHIYRHVAGIGA